MKSPCLQCAKPVAHLIHERPFCSVACNADYAVGYRPAPDRVYVLCGEALGLGRQFFTGNGVNRDVHRHVECDATEPWKARAEKAEAEVARPAEYAGDRSASASTKEEP